MTAAVNFGTGHVYYNTLSGSGDIVGLDLVDCATATIWIFGTSGGNYTGVPSTGLAFEGSPVPHAEVTNLNWYPMQASRVDSSGIETTTGNIPDGTLRSWQVSVSGFGSVRVRATGALTAPCTILIQAHQYAIEPQPAGTQTVNLTCVTPTAASTTAVGVAASGGLTGALATGLGGTRSGFIYMSLQSTVQQGGTTAASGGTLNVYLQASPDSGTTWVDYAALTQLASNTTATYAVSISRGQHSGSSFVTVGTGLNPALTAGSLVNGDYSDRLRVVLKTGVSWSGLYVQTILGIFTA